MRITLSDRQVVYAETYGKKTNPAVFLIHGGPGDSAYTFKLLAHRLSESFRVIVSEQRGCARSDFAHEQTITVRQLIADFEEIREAFNIRQWLILGHSFGGIIAIEYAVQKPESILGIVLENPAIDIFDSARCILENYILCFEHRGDSCRVKRIQRILADNCKTELIKAVDYFPNHIKNEFWGFDRLPEVYCEILKMSAEIGSQNQKREIFKKSLLKDAVLYDDGWSKLKAVSLPVRLIYGECDYITNQRIRDLFLQNAHLGSVCRIDSSGHYIHLDNSDKMAESIYQFAAEVIHGLD